MQRRGWLLLLALLLFVLAVVLIAAFWPWVRSWLPQSSLVEAWINYLVVDLNIGRWGPVVTLLMVAIVELIWALNLGRRSESFERQWQRLDRLHDKEIQVLNQEISLLSDERRTLRTELELRGDLIREEKARLWSKFEDLVRASGLHGQQGTGSPGNSSEIIRSSLLRSQGARELPAKLRSEWLRVISRLERVAMVGEVVGWSEKSALQLQQHVDELLRLGNGCFQLGEADRALVHFDKIIELAPSYFEAHINRAVVNLDAGRYQSAIQDLEHAAGQGESPWVYLYRGAVAEQMGESRRSLEDYTRAIRLDERMKEPHYRRGMVYLSLGEHDKAIIDENKVLESDESHTGAYLVRGMAWAQQGKYQGALEDLNRACALAPDWSRAFYQRGQVRHQLAMTEEALADFDRALQLEPEFTPALLARGRVHGDLGDHWQAMADFDRAIELEPESASAHHARGRARATVKEFDRAVEDYGRALELEPGKAEVLADLGAALEKKGDHSRAVQELDRALAINPSLAIAYYARGLAYGSLGQYDRASRDLNKAVELDPSLNRKERRSSGGSSV